MCHFLVVLRAALLALGGFALSGMQDDLSETLLQVLKPNYPKATFHHTVNGRTVCRLESRVYQNPDRIGPDRGGITVEFELAESQSFDLKSLSPTVLIRDAQTYKVHRHALLSGDGHGLLRVLIKVPLQDPPPSHLLDSMMEACRSYAATWRPGAPQLVIPSGAWDYPGGDNMVSLGDTIEKPQFCTLEDIADCGAVYLHPRGDRCLLVWYSPDEGIGYGDVVLYRKVSEGWKLKRVAKHLLLPRIQLGLGFAVVRAGRSWSWPRMVLCWPVKGPIKALQR